MNTFVEYEKTNISNQEYFGSFDNNEDRLLLDMDSLVTRKDNLISRNYGSTIKKCLLGEDNEEVDGNRWFEKSVQDWSQEETINWLIFAASNLGQSYSSIQQSFAIPGKQLITLTRNDFLNQDPINGERLYTLLHSHNMHNYRKNKLTNYEPYYSINNNDNCSNNSNNKINKCIGSKPKNNRDKKRTDNYQTLCTEDEMPALSSNSVSDAESDNSVEISTKRQPGRPKIFKNKKNSTSQGKLWEFIRDLLRNKKTCPSLICWEDYSQAKFRFVRSDEVAKLWGSRKGNTKMTYEKLSRAMRYYYKRKIFLPVLGRRLVYQFGPNATGWQTDNPNFRL